MKILYIEPYCGVAGDMLNAALLGLEGAPSIDSVTEHLRSIPFKEEWSIQLSEVTRHAVQANFFNVTVKEHHHHHSHSSHRHSHHHHRTLKDIVTLINSADKFSERVKQKAVEVFQKLAEAEALVHGSTTDKVHFHEVGAVDAVIDIVSCCYIIDELSPDAVYASEINLGTGSVSTAHGELPVPVPATMNLIKGLPVNYTNIESELATPTGCSLLSVLVDEWQRPDCDMKLLSASYGAGSRDLKERASVLRVSMLENSNVPADSSLESDTVAVIETNIDDMTPEEVGALQEYLFSAGVLDCTVSPLFMKKQRPAFLIKIITSEDDFLKIAKIVLEESSSLGVRYRFEKRAILKRKIITEKTPYGDVLIKVAFSGDGQTEKFKIEYDSCLKLARENNLSYWNMEKKISQFLAGLNRGDSLCKKVKK
jgi:uncharacterized protein (TIGR00299 family) protein